MHLVRGLGAAGFAILAGAMASCAALSGLQDYSACTENCDGTSRGPATVQDASTGTSPDTDASMTTEDASPPVEDVSEARPGDASNPADATGDQSSSPPVDGAVADVSAPQDAGPDVIAPVDSGGGVGPSCGPLASRTHCSDTQVCCASLATQSNSCSAKASCSSSATLACSTASDCPSSAPICCGQMTLVPDALGDLPPKCTATMLAASCAASCNNLPPSDATTCKYPPVGVGTIRLCSHDADCTSNLATLGGGCYNFNSAPVSWCSTLAAGAEGVHQP